MPNTGLRTTIAQAFSTLKSLTFLIGRVLTHYGIDVSEGSLIAGERRDIAAGLPNQESVRVEGRHFAPEDSPNEIGRAIAEWLQRL